MKPWRVRSAASDCIDLRFAPEFVRVSENGKRDGFFTYARQVFGCYSGRLMLDGGPDGGEPIELRDMFGWIEDHAARW